MEKKDIPKKEIDILDKFFAEMFEDIKHTEFTTVKTVKKIGNSGSVIVPNEFIGKSARVLILREPKNNFIEFRLHKKEEEEKEKS